MMHSPNPRFFQSVFACILFFLLALQPVQAQVFEGDLELSTQAEVDAFDYTEITGNLRIQGTDITLTHLSVYPHLVVICFLVVQA